MWAPSWNARRKMIPNPKESGPSAVACFHDCRPGLASGAGYVAWVDRSRSIQPTNTSSAGLARMSESRVKGASRYV